MIDKLFLFLALTLYINDKNVALKALVKNTESTGSTENMERMEMMEMIELMKITRLWVDHD